MPFKCQSCGFGVLNRRYPKCEACGVTLAVGLSMSDEERNALFEADRLAAEAQWRERQKADEEAREQRRRNAAT
jgi:hypothetical protein